MFDATSQDELARFVSSEQLIGKQKTQHSMILATVRCFLSPNYLHWADSFFPHVLFLNSTHAPLTGLAAFGVDTSLLVDHRTLPRHFRINKPKQVPKLLARWQGPKSNIECFFLLHLPSLFSRSCPQTQLKQLHRHWQSMFPAFRRSTGCQIQISLRFPHSHLPRSKTKQHNCLLIKINQRRDH
jgi:hypothetical protein